MCQDSPGDVALIMKLLPNIIGRKVLSEKWYRSRNFINIQILSLKKCLAQSMSISDPIPSKCKGMLSLALFFILMYSICHPSSCTFAVPF